MDDATKNAIIADLDRACRDELRLIREQYEALPNSSESSRKSLLGDTVMKVRTDGTLALPPWETTPLRTLALHPTVAYTVAEKFGFTPSEILEIGAWGLAHGYANGMWASSGASEYLTRLCISTHARYLRAMDGWKESNKIVGEQSDAQRRQSERLRDEEERKQRARADHMRVIQDAGATKTAQRSGELADKMVAAFNSERKKQATLEDKDIYTNVAITLNNQNITTLQGNPHTQDSVRRILAKFRSQLDRKQ